MSIERFDEGVNSSWNVTVSKYDCKRIRVYTIGIIWIFLLILLLKCDYHFTSCYLLSILILSENNQYSKYLT